MISSIDSDEEVEHLGESLSKQELKDTEGHYPCISHDLKHRLGVPKGISVFDAMFSDRFSQHIDPLLLNPILKYLSTNDEFYLLGSLSKTADVMDMIKLMDMLGIQPPKHDIEMDWMHKLLARLLYDKKRDPRYQLHKDRRYAARRTAVTFLFALLSGKIDLRDHRLRSKVFVKFEFIASHPKTFCKRVRHQMRSVYLAKLSPLISKKQQSILNN